MLVIPDIWDRFVVQELVNMLFKSMGFRQIVCQQVSSLWSNASLPLIDNDRNLWQRHMELAFQMHAWLTWEP